ncbi:MAG: SigmaK-factor processing regulatory BofA [Clostridiales bacterium]|nr:SigmaK-factor processing regulatory BofA [Clostridiales bacterium]
MKLQLGIIAFLVLLMGALWFLSHRATPNHGAMKWLERLFSGLALCYGCSLALRLFGFELSYGPLPSLLAGTFGLPGVGLAAMIQWLP